MAEYLASQGNGYQFGSTGTTQGGAAGTDPSAMVYGENAAERTANQWGNFQYGGYGGGAADAIAAAQANTQPYQDATMGYGAAAAGYGDTLGGYGTGYNEQMGGAQDRTAPLGYNYLQSDLENGQAGQYGAADALMNFANNGPGPSAAQAQLNLALNQGMNNQLALARSGRGMGESAASLSQAGRNQAQLAGMAQDQSAALAAQEQQAWQAQQAQALAGAGNLYGSGRASDIAAAGYYTGAQQTQTGLNDQYALGLGGLSNDAMGTAGNLNLGAGTAATNAGQLQLGLEQNANAINSANLASNNAYEQNLTNIFAAQQGVGGSAPGTDWGGIIGGVAGGALGFMAGGPAGGAAGAAGGSAVGSEVQNSYGHSY